ncbi:MAG: peptidoglycan DD-metalloendopeptidase family protein [Acidobacteriota bacterium]
MDRHPQIETSPTAHNPQTGGGSIGTERSAALIAALRVTPARNIAPVLPFDMATAPHVVFDFSKANRVLAQLDLSDPGAFSEYIFGEIEDRKALFGIGRYGEARVIYRHSALFSSEDHPRTIHLGVDLFAAPGTEVRAPVDAVVHSFANNPGVGNYGPTIILEHSLAGIDFFTLYGHLSSASIGHLEVRSPIARGDRVGRIGEAWENGGWPPHLHFQIVSDIGGWRGDFPGVAAPSERHHFLALCPDPNLLLRIPGLGYQTPQEHDEDE